MGSNTEIDEIFNSGIKKGNKNDKKLTQTCSDAISESIPTSKVAASNAQTEAHEWINEIPTVPIYYLAKPQPRERVDFVTANKPAAKRKQADNDGDGTFGDSRGMAKSDGLNLFSQEDLKIGKGDGNTKDCPFDCWCCY